MGYKIKEIRKKRNMTQEELAEKSGISRTTICFLESGRDKTTTSKTLLKLAAALEVDLDEIFFA